MRVLILLALLASCGNEKRKVCKEEYEYKYNGYTYVEYKHIKCEDVDE